MPNPLRPLALITPTVMVCVNPKGLLSPALWGAPLEKALKKIFTKPIRGIVEGRWTTGLDGFFYRNKHDGWDRLPCHTAKGVRKFAGRRSARRLCLSHCWQEQGT